MKLNCINIALFTICILLPVLPLLAQPTTPTSAPIDGGLSLLIAAGAGYGVKRLSEKRKQKEEKDK